MTSTSGPADALHAPLRAWSDRPVVLAGGVALLFLASGPVYVLSGDVGGGGRSTNAWVGVPLAGAIGLLFLLAAREHLAGRRSRRSVVLAALVALAVYAPMPVWQFDWMTVQSFVIATAVLTGRRWPAVTAIVTAVVVTLGSLFLLDPDHGAGHVIFVSLYWVFGLTLGSGALYGSIRLVGAQRQLVSSRQALARSAIDDERARLAREVHDLIGQSMSAVALNGDLALALLRRDPGRRPPQVDLLAATAREAVLGLRAVAVDEHEVSLRAELASASALLAAAGVQIDVRTDLQEEDDRSADGPGTALLAWSLRETATNIVRHSDATTAAVVLETHDAARVLSVENDRPRAGRGDGHGLAGLRERALRCGGTVDVEHDPLRFRVTVTVPTSWTH